MTRRLRDPEIADAAPGHGPEPTQCVMCCDGRREPDSVYCASCTAALRAEDAGMEEEILEIVEGPAGSHVPAVTTPAADAEGDSVAIEDLADKLFAAAFHARLCEAVRPGTKTPADDLLYGWAWYDEVSHAAARAHVEGRNRRRGEGRP